VITGIVYGKAKEFYEGVSEGLNNYFGGGETYALAGEGYDVGGSSDVEGSGLIGLLMGGNRDNILKKKGGKQIKNRTSRKSSHKINASGKLRKKRRGSRK